MKKYIGIDLGTTYSCMSQMDDLSDNPEVVMNTCGEVTTPSVVFFTEMGNTVGTQAKRRLRTMPDQTVEHVKRSMGTDKTWDILDRTYTPIDLSACILEEVFRPLAQENVTEYNIVITCPASYNNTQRRFVIEAAKKAGLNEPKIINEPTAAALSYCSKESKDRGNVIIFDLGGGTLDVTAIHFDKVANRYEVLASDGKPFLGGVDWDKVIEDMIYDLASEAFDQAVDELKEDVVVSSNVKTEAEMIKKELTKMDYSETLYIKGEPVDISITQKEFENRTEGLLKEATDMIQTVIDVIDRNRSQHPGISDFSIGGIVLVGGSCKMPQVKRKIAEQYPQFANDIWLYDPDTAISKGAAIFAKIGVPQEPDPVPVPEPVPGPKTVPAPVPAPVDPTGAGSKQPDFVEVLSSTLGTDEEGTDGVVVCRNIMFKNDTIPGRGQSNFRLSKGQTKLKNIVYSNQCRDSSVQTWPVEECSIVSDFIMDLPFTADDRERITITFDVSVDGILKYILDMRGTKREYEIPLENLERNVEPTRKTSY